MVAIDGCRLKEFSHVGTPAASYPEKTRARPVDTERYPAQTDIELFVFTSEELRTTADKTRMKDQTSSTRSVRRNTSLTARHPTTTSISLPPRRT